MNRTKIKYVIILLISVFTHAYSWQADTTTTHYITPPDTSKKSKASIFLDNVSLRRTFDGTSKDEQKPASINWIYDKENNYRYLTVDLGLKITEIELFPKRNFIITIIPKLEWHKDESPSEEKKKNNLSGGVNIEYLPYAINSHYLVPFAIGSTDYKYDFIKQQGLLPVKIWLSAKSIRRWGPGSNINNEKGNLAFRYYLYTGMERYELLSKINKVSSFWSNRVFFELYPIPSESNNFQITFDYSYRMQVKDELYTLDDMSWLSIAMNYYFDTKQRVGIGVDFNHGNDPTSEFVKTNKLALGIKLKL